MSRTSSDVIADIQSFRPVRDDWLPLDGLLDELWSTGDACLYMAELFGVLEQFSDGDGAGVLWSVVHGLESLAGYELELVYSIKRQPSELGIIMIRRLRIGGIQTVDSVSLIELLKDVAMSKRTSKRVQDLAARFAVEHTS